MSKRLVYHLYLSFASSWVSFFLAFLAAVTDQLGSGITYLIGGGGT